MHLEFVKYGVIELFLLLLAHPMRQIVEKKVIILCELVENLTGYELEGFWVFVVGDVFLGDVGFSDGFFCGALLIPVRFYVQLLLEVANFGVG